jgi:hypothetical protein
MIFMYKDKYKDFKDRPRWKEYPVVEMHPLGIVVQVANYFAFYDSTKKEWDYTKSVNLVNPSEAAQSSLKSALR